MHTIETERKFTKSYVSRTEPIHVGGDSFRIKSSVT